MIFGMVVSTTVVVVLGVATYAVLVAQMLVGLRKIHFKGKMHQIVHRRVAWTLFAVSTVHGMLAVVYVLGLRIG